MVETLDKIGEFFKGILEKIVTALGGKDKAGTNVLIALAMLVTAVLMFVFRKKLMKPVIKYRKKRAVRRATRRTYRKRK